MEVIQREEQRIYVGGGDGTAENPYTWSEYERLENSGSFYGGYVTMPDSGVSYMAGGGSGSYNTCQCVFDSMINSSNGKFNPSDCTGTTGFGQFSGVVNIDGRSFFMIIDIGLSGGHPYYYTECATKTSAPFGKTINGESATKYTFYNTTASGNAFEMWILVPDSAQDIIDKFLCN